MWSYSSKYLTSFTFPFSKSPCAKRLHDIVAPQVAASSPADKAADGRGNRSVIGNNREVVYKAVKAGVRDETRDVTDLDSDHQRRRSNTLRLQMSACLLVACFSSFFAHFAYLTLCRRFFYVVVSFSFAESFCPHHILSLLHRMSPAICSLNLLTVVRMSL